MTYIDFPHQFNQGWECPKCGSVYAPSFPMCTRCAGSRETMPPQPHTLPWSPSPTIAPYDPYRFTTTCQAENHAGT